MFRRSVFSSLALLAGGCLLVLPVSSARANVIANVGTGTDTVQVYFNWADSFNARYVASYGSSPTDTIDGYDATMLAVMNDPNLTVTWTNYGTTTPNYFMNNATYTGGHTSVGSFYSSSMPNNYWHEWVNYGSGWVLGQGASVDTLSSGDAIGWVYGSNFKPVPEPASLSIAALAGGLLIRRRKR